MKKYSKNMKIYEIGPYFYKHYWKKYNLMKMEMNIYTEYLLAMKIDEKGHTGRDLIFEEKTQKAIEKKLGCKFIRINKIKEGYDAEYEGSRIQTFICKFKDRQLKQLNKKLKELGDNIKKTGRSNHSIK